MTQTNDPAVEARRPLRPTRKDVVRHLVDGAGAPLTYLLVESQAGARWGAVVALAMAVLVGLWRRHHGKPLAVVAVATTIVALHSASAIAVGEGRAFFLPEVAINVLGLVVCLGSLLLPRPVTQVVCTRLGVERGTGPATGRRHRLLTLAWVALWALHLVPLLWLYAIDSVAGLAALSAFVNKPTLVALAIATVVVVKRGQAPDVISDPTSDPSSARTTA